MSDVMLANDDVQEKDSFIEKCYQKSSKASDSKSHSDLSLSCDSTSHSEISVMDNQDYASNIIIKVNQLYNEELVNELCEKENKEGLLKEGQKQVFEICRCIEHLKVHNDKYIVIFLIKIGTILNKVEDYLDEKSVYKKWERDNFGIEKERYFQQAKQIAKIGEFAKNNASLGKTRLLEFIRLKKENESIDEYVKKYPFPDTAKDSIDDDEGYLTKVHIDAIITVERFHAIGMKFVEFEYAKMLAYFTKGSIRKKDIARLSELLKGKRNKPKLFQKYVMDKMTILQSKKNKKHLSVESVVINLLNKFSKIDMKDISIQNNLKSNVTLEHVKKVRSKLTQLISILESN